MPVQQPAGILPDPNGPPGTFNFVDEGLPRLQSYGYSGTYTINNQGPFNNADGFCKVDTGRVYHYDPTNGQNHLTQVSCNQNLYGTDGMIDVIDPNTNQPVIYTANQSDGGGNLHLLHDPDFTEGRQPDGTPVTWFDPPEHDIVKAEPTFGTQTVLNNQEPEQSRGPVPYSDTSTHDTAATDSASPNHDDPAYGYYSGYNPVFQQGSGIESGGCSVEKLFHRVAGAESAKPRGEKTGASRTQPRPHRLRISTYANYSFCFEYANNADTRLAVNTDWSGRPVP